jgi:succinyl-CoA synthetase alpha subunit
VVVKSAVRKGDYRDSVVLMRISKELESRPGIRKGSVMMGTENNKQLLRDAGLFTAEIERAGANDLIIAVEAESEELASGAISEVEGILEAEAEVEVREIVCKTLKAAVESMPDANLVLVSTPGEFAAREAMRALKAGKHVMIFSSDVPIEEEAELKNFAAERGLLVMGPDCGTAIISGVGLGFSNVVRRGPVGIVGAAGTGIQEVSSILDEVGVSHAIGTGSHDLSDTVGGVTMLAGLRSLQDDEDTKAIVLVSKPPSPRVAKRVLEIAKGCGKPVVVNFIGGDPKLVEEAGLIPAVTLEDAARKAIALTRGEEPREVKFTIPEAEVNSIAERESKGLKSSQRYIRGLFSGGTMCAEALVLLRDLVGDVYSNVALEPRLKLESGRESRLHTCVDMGTEEFVRRVPHPMIDFRFRRERILREAKDPEVAVILLDVVLGLGANPDPAGELVSAIKEAKELAARENRYLPFVASVCGTEGDPQKLSSQEAKLRGAGVVVMPSNAQAVRMAAFIATRGEARV